MRIQIPACVLFRLSTQCRIFHGYLRSILDDFRKGAVFEAATEYLMYVVEFQKRGLPHAHIALRLKGDQPRTPEEIDRYISAEVPEVTADSPPYVAVLNGLVKHHMMHKACYPERCFAQSSRPHAPKRNTCKYGFPYALQPVTTIDDETGKVLYRRRRPGDERVASYNPYLLLKYKCHINVQYAESIKLIKYMRKYMCKVRLK